MSEFDREAPDGIADTHIRLSHPRYRRANPISLILTSALLLLACLGLLGGAPSPTRTIDSKDVRLTVVTPVTLRSGLFFETRVLIEPKRPIGELVLALSPALWRDITINTAIPAAEKEEYDGGMFRLSFGSGKPGKPIALKVDGQVNPPLIGRNEGQVAVYDGTTRLIALPIRTTVLP